MLGFIIYLMFQIALAACAIRIARKFKGAQDEDDPKIDSRSKKITGLVVVPIFALAYFSMGSLGMLSLIFRVSRKPPKL